MRGDDRIRERAGVKARAWKVLLAGAILLAAGSATVASRLGVEMPEEAWVPPDASSVTASIGFFETKLERDPGNALLMSNLTVRYLNRFQLTADPTDAIRAETLARELLERDPDPTAARSRLAAALLTRHEFAEARVRAEEAVALDPDRVAAWATLHDAAFAAGRYERAAEALERLEWGSVTHRVKWAFWLDASGQGDAARAMLRPACDRIASWSIPEQTAFCWTELGGLEAGGGRTRAAAALYAAALEAVPGYRGAVEGLADLAYGDEDLETAAGLYRRIATDAHPDLYLRLAEIARIRGEEGTARDWERRFLEVAAAPGAEPLYGRWLARFLVERPEARDRALEIALREVERRPAVESWDGLAWVRFRRGEPAAALAASDRAIAWGEPSPTIAYHRGRILEALERSAEAKSWLERATADPTLLEPEARLDLRVRG